MRSISEHGGIGKISRPRLAASHNSAWESPAVDVLGGEDYLAHLELMTEWCRERGVEVWAYCLMPSNARSKPQPAANRLDLAGYVDFSG
jgi:hypothetical protein